MSANNIQSSRREVLPFMPEKEKHKFLDLLKVQSTSKNEKRMVVFVIDKLNQMGLTPVIDEVGNILVTKGESENFPCICSHLDTVHSFCNDYQMIIHKVQKREIVLAFSGKKQVGTGGDDKCGIYATLYMLQKFQNIKAVFFTQEEAGLVGSSNIEFEFFDDVGYIIQLDRWGRGDFICQYMYESTVNADYLKVAEHVLREFKFKETEGLITDSISLWDNEIGISAVNVSCGYYQHHSNKETIDLNEFWNSVLFTQKLITVLGENTYPSKPTGYVGKYKNSWWKEEGTYYDWETDTYTNKKPVSVNTGTSLKEKEEEDYDYYYIRDIAYMMGSECLLDESEEILQEALVEFNTYYEQDGLPPLFLWEFKSKLKGYYKAVF